MVEISSKEDFEKWLEGKPQAVLVVLATRRALRDLPRLSRAIGTIPESMEPILFIPSVRCILISALSVNRSFSPAVSENLRATAEVAHASAAFVHAEFDTIADCYESDLPAGFAASAAALAAFSVATALRRETSAIAALETAASVNFKAGGITGKVVPNIERCDLPDLSRDISAIDQGMSPRELLLNPIWHSNDMPEETADDWKRLRTHLGDGKDPTWRFWIGLYESFLEGGEKNWPLLTEVALIPNEIWEDGPEAVAAEIEKIEAKYPSEMLARAERRLADGAAPRFGHDEERAAREELERQVRALQDELARLKPEHGGIGHNMPPEEMDLASEQLDKVQEATEAIAEELAKPEPDMAELVEKAKWWLVALKWIGRKCDLAVDELIKNGAKVAVVGGGSMFVLEKLGFTFQALIDWLKALGLLT